MARAWAVTRVAVACTVFSGLCLGGGTAHAGAGDLVDGAVGSADGSVVGDAQGKGWLGRSAE